MSPDDTPAGKPQRPAPSPLVDRYLAVRRRTEALAKPLVARGSGRAVDARRQSGQVAPGPYRLVLRDLPADAVPAGLSGVRPEPSPICSIPITRPSGLASRAPAWADHPPVGRRGRGLSGPCRRGHGPPADHLADRRGDGAPGPGPGPRGAAPGADPDGPAAPVRPVAAAAGLSRRAAVGTSVAAGGLRYLAFEGGLVEIGDDGPGFAFDNERPRHKVYLEPYRLADRLVTNGEWLAFIEDGGYRRADLWLSDGWAASTSRAGMRRSTGGGKRTAPGRS
jgi:hypothetical protein